MLRIIGTLPILLGLIAGCSDTRKPGPDNGPRDALDDLGQMLKSLGEERQKPPAKLADLEAVEPMIPLASPLIRSGDLIYIWGAEYSPGGKKLVAYEKKAETAGGWVLLQDGTVKEVSADEFNAATRAK